ncbi:MAG: hypothetical protein HWE39_19710 [Oceanospirillaceae bacterium]|nr:hypothetical protein [Salipiger sp. HF18]NVK43477.1 hypothetical protein [Oceanospirillaceae bacterium]
MAKRKLPRTPYLNPQFGAAVKDFGLSFLKTQSINHRGSKGTAREGVLGTFFREQLPGRYSVTEGEVVDLYGRSSPQLDLMFYDSSVDFPFRTAGADILAAEALLSSIEVKSKLTKAEIEKSVKAARKLRKLKPFGRPLAGNDVGMKATGKKDSRYFHCLFAYETDLSENNWLESEVNRLKSACGTGHALDLVYVLDRGLIHVGHSIGKMEDGDGGAITNFYFSILNFIQREARRREATPFERYTQSAKNAWIKV